MLSYMPSPAYGRYALADGERVNFKIYHIYLLYEGYIHAVNAAL